MEKMMKLKSIRYLIDELDDLTEGLVYLKYNVGAQDLPKAARLAMMEGIERRKDLVKAAFSHLEIEV